MHPKRSRNVLNLSLREDYLECEGICHAREPNEKIFLALLENLYKNDAEFKEEFELLELEFE